jgi:excisionase family DNA binding protein
MPDLGTQDAADILGVHRLTLIRWADDGKVPCWVTPGGQRRFRAEDIEALRQPVPPVPRTDEEAS